MVLATLLTSVAIPAHAEEEIPSVKYEPSAKESLLMSLGLIDSEDYVGDEGMTRGDFAVLLAKTLKLEIDDGAEGGTGVPEVDDSQIINPASTIFKDVDTASDEYGAIMAVYKNGYMVGVADELFAPEYNMVLSEAVKVFVDLLGFAEQADAQGGYPAGYDKIASSFSLYKGLSCGFNDTATKKDIASLLTNVMETPVAEVVSFKPDGLSYIASASETFMTELMKIRKFNGVITDNGVTAVNGPSTVSANQIICGGITGITMEVSPDSAYVRKYLGRRVTAYYSTADDDCYKFVYAKPTDDVITIHEKDYIDYDRGVLKYRSANGSLKTINIGRYTSVIDNGVYTSLYDGKDIFDITDGQITIVESGGGYLPIIEDYKSFVVSKTDAEKNEIYSKMMFANADDGVNSVDLLDYKEVCIIDENGKSVPFSSIQKGDVVSCLLSSNFRYAEIVISTKKIEGVRFKSISADEYESEEQTYVKSDILKTVSNPELVRIGNEYMLYFSAFGTLVWIEETALDEDTMLEGIFLKYMTPNYDNDYSFGVKIYTSNGIIKTYYIQKKFKLNGSTVRAEKAYTVSESITESGTESRTESGELYKENVIGKPILYKEEDSIITEMITPLGYGKEDDQRGWYQITYDYSQGDDKLQHYDVGTGSSFEGVLNYDKATCNIYSIPIPENDEIDREEYLWNENDLIAINDVEFESGQFIVEGYAKTKDAIYADVIIHSDNGLSGAPDPRVALLITGVRKDVDEDMEIYTTFTGYEFVLQGAVTKKTYKVAKNAKIVDDNGPTGDSVQDLERGDIIRIGKNEKGEIRDISKSYDLSNDFASNKACNGTAYTYMGYFINVEDNGFRISARVESTNESSDGSTNESSDNFLEPQEILEKITDTSITAEERKDYSSRIRTYLADANYPVVIVDTQTKKYTFTEASLDEVFSYKDTPGKFDKVVVLTHYFAGRMGAVVYR